MKADQKSVSRNIVIILILFSLTTIFGCKWGSWSFDLFGGDPINGDDDDSGDNGDGGDGNGDRTGDGNGNDGDGISVNFHLLFFPPTLGAQKSTNRLSFFPHLKMDPISQRLRVSSIREGREMNLRCHRMGHWLHI